jgi:hypothetical protein
LNQPLGDQNKRYNEPLESGKNDSNLMTLYEEFRDTPKLKKDLSEGSFISYRKTLLEENKSEIKNDFLSTKYT